MNTIFSRPTVKRWYCLLEEGECLVVGAYPSPRKGVNTGNLLYVGPRDRYCIKQPSSAQYNIIVTPREYRA